MKIVSNRDIPPEVKEEDEDDKMDLDEEPQLYDYRPSSPDFSWLPPIPNSSYAPIPSSSLSPIPNTTTLPPDKLTLFDKYRHRQPFTSSQLSGSSFSLPPLHPAPPRPPPTSSFPSLLACYNATAGEPSVSLAQTPLRQQAADLLRRVIAPPEIFAVSDTLSAPLPGPGLAISASASDTLPAPTIPVNPNPTGILSRLVREMRSPYLPPSLRDRLTTLRPPLALNDEHGQPVYYGDPVRGPDTAALNKARGKPPGDQTEDGQGDQEAYYRYTWDAGPRGADKFSRAKLPSGKKVVKAGEGEDLPRTVEGKPAGGQGTGTIKLRLDRSPSVLSPGGTLSVGQGVEADGTAGISPGGTAPPGQSGQPSISLRIPSPANTPTSTSPHQPSPLSGSRPTIKLSTASLSPNPLRPSPNPSPSASTDPRNNLQAPPISSEGQDQTSPASTFQPTPSVPRIKLSPRPAMTGTDTPESGVQSDEAVQFRANPNGLNGGSGGGGGGGIKIRFGVKKEAGT